MATNKPHKFSQPVRIGGDLTVDNSGDIRTRPVGSNTGGGSLYARHGYFGGSAGGMHILNTSGGNDFSIMPDGSPASNILFECNGDAIQWGSLEIATGNLALQCGLLLTNAISPSAFGGGTTNDWAPTGFSQCAVIRASTTTSSVRTITGLAGGTGGRVVTIENVSTTLAIGYLLLTANDASSASGNRFLLPNDMRLYRGESITLWYDATSAGWRPLVHAPKGLATALANALSMSKGDILVYDGSTLVKHAHGVDGAILQYDSTQTDGLSSVLSVNVPRLSLSAEILADNPTSYYPCNETSGTTLNDLGSAALNMTLQGTPGIDNVLAHSRMQRTGATDKYLDITSSSGFGLVSSNPTGASIPSGSWTFCCLSSQIGITARPGLTAFVSLTNNAASTNAVLCGLQSSGKPVIQLTGTNLSSGLGWAAGIAQTYMFHFLKDASTKTVSFYVNGIFRGSAAYTTEYSTTLTSPKFRLGGTQDGASYPGGQIGEAALFYGSLLSETRIVAHAVAAGLYGV